MSWGVRYLNAIFSMPRKATESALLRFRYDVYISACSTKFRNKFGISSDDRLILLVPPLSSSPQELPLNWQLLATTPNISCSRVDLKVTELAHTKSLPASALMILPQLSSVPSLVRFKLDYADFFIGQVLVQTRYFTDIGDLTILTDSMDVDLDKVYTDAGNSKEITSEFHVQAHIASWPSHSTCFACQPPSHPLPPEPHPFSCRRSTVPRAIAASRSAFARGVPP